MKKFLFSFSHAYGLGVAIIIAESKEKAIQMADECPYVWSSYQIIELDNLELKEQVIIIEE